MELAAERNFKVKYYEKDKETWIVESHLIDSPHDICLKAEVNMPSLTITDAKLKFNRYPIDGCNKMEDKIKCLVGLKIDRNFMDKAINMLTGPCGCFNITSLLTISIPGIIYYYYPYKIRKKEMKQEDFDNLVKTQLKNVCLGHTLKNEQNASFRLKDML